MAHSQIISLELDRNSSGFSGRKQVISKKKKGLHRNSSGFSGRKQVISKKQTGEKLVSWESQASRLKLHFIGTEPVNFFWAQFSFGGYNSCLGAQAVICAGTAPEWPSWRRACCKFTAIYRTVTIAFSLKRYCSKSVLLKKWELFEVTKRCPKTFSTISLICENTI